jgi:hypothetical protein
VVPVRSRVVHGFFSVHAQRNHVGGETFGNIFDSAGTFLCHDPPGTWRVVKCHRSSSQSAVSLHGSAPQHYVEGELEWKGGRGRGIGGKENWGGHDGVCVFEREKGEKYGITGVCLRVRDASVCVCVCDREREREIERERLDQLGFKPLIP